jgi:hypothetical protein
MPAPVAGFNAEVPIGLHGESYIEIAPSDDVMTDDAAAIEITLTDEMSDRSLIVSHDEARQIIAGLASVIE